MTNVDLCETQKDLATKINANATETLAREAVKKDVFFVYVSTDYVFDGKKGMKKEGDVPNPLGEYDKSKLAGELALNNLTSVSIPDIGNIFNIFYHVF
jgi:dTDP-4-dehydrorhamnose reductase